MIIVEGVVIA